LAREGKVGRPPKEHIADPRPDIPPLGPFLQAARIGDTMGAYSDRLEREVRLERMRPREVDEAMRRRPAIYVPTGSIEFHGWQNPLGLDATKAHEQLVGLAARLGGVVYPPLFLGVGGGHVAYPHTFMVEAEPMRAIVLSLLRGFERDGFRDAILLSGHAPNRFEYLLQAREAYLAQGGTMRVLVLYESQAPGVGSDHAGHFETSMMLHLHPETVDIGELGDGAPEGDAQKNWMADSFRDHPCWGIVGVDPRGGQANAALGRLNVERLMDFLDRWLHHELDELQCDGWNLKETPERSTRSATGARP
jgi:creatinine amidohydrolase